MKANLLPPALIFYVDRLPTGVGGRAVGPLIQILKKYENDEGLLAHELEHAKQFWFLPPLHGPLYLFSRSYRLWAEVSAYRKQMAKPPAMTVESAARRLMSPKYKLNLTLEQAIAAIKN